MDLNAFVAMSVILLAVDVLTVVLSLRQGDLNGRLLACCMALAAVVDISYLVSVSAKSYFGMSFASSIYFSSIDLLLIALIVYVVHFVEMWQKRPFGIALAVMAAFSVLDICSLMTNPFVEVALTYDYNPASVVHWVYAPYFLFRFHLFLCYTMVGFLFVVVISKVVSVPKVYRARYNAIIAGLSIIILVNAAFLFVGTAVFDYSLVFYSVLGAYLCLSQYRLSERSILHSVREMVLDQLGHAIILFDNEDRFVSCNADAEVFVPKRKRVRSYKTIDFLEDLGVAKRITDIDVDWTFRQRFELDGSMVPRRFELRMLKDERGRLIGRLVVIVDEPFNFDLLTGFHTKTAFERDFLSGMPIGMNLPVAVCICDLNRLADLNAEMGRESGDDAIKILADLVAKHLPSDAYFARHDDANLLAVCGGSGLARVRDCLSEARKELQECKIGSISLDMQFAIAVATEESPSVLDAAQTALSALRTRKMLDYDSAHSSLLSSLAMTQRQNDGETEEHVRRTRAFADALAQRLGLSDWERGSLALLCLLHDIGKVGVPLEILNKPGKLTDAEWEVMKSHVVKGYEIAMASEELRGIADCILHHHERWDGKGYPDGLSKESIPLLSRIVAVVDSFDAMTYDRPYRNALSREDAMSELRRCAGFQFDPVIVAEFLGMLDDGVVLDEADSEADVVGAIRDFGLDDPDDYLEAGLMESAAVIPAGQSSFLLEPISDNGALLTAVRYSRYILDRDKMRIRQIDDRFEELTGYSAEDVRRFGLRQLDLVFAEDWEAYSAEVDRQYAQFGEAYIDHRIRRKDGMPVNVFCYGRPYVDPETGDEGDSVVIADLASAYSVRRVVQRARSSAARNMKRLEDRVRRDAGTGLLNREGFRSDVQERLLADAEEMILIMMDIDHFKEYNDTFGHPEGDALLAHMAHTLDAAVSVDGVCCRVGGDEFAAAVFFDKGTSPKVMRARVNVIWGRVTSSMRLFRPDLSVSFGVAKASEDIKTVAALYEAADRQLYRAKQAGRDCVMFDWD